jgi:hypothetical protein
VGRGRETLRARGVFLFGFFIFAASAARADEEALKAARAAANRVHHLLSHGCPALAKAALPVMEEKFAALSEPEKKRLQREVEGVRRNSEHAFQSWDAGEVKDVINSSLMEAENNYHKLDSVAGVTEYDELVQTVIDQLSDEVNKKLLPADAAAAFQQRLEVVKAEFRKHVVKVLERKWAEVGEFITQKQAGWENDKARDLEDVGLSLKLGCDNSDMVVRVSQNFLDDILFVSALGRYPDATELTKLRDEATAQRDKAMGIVKRIHEEVLSETEKLPKGKIRNKMADFYRGTLQGHERKSSVKQRHDPWYADEGLFDRMEAIVKSCDKDAKQAKAEASDRLDKLVQAANDAWPGFLRTWKLEKLEAVEALEKPDAWKGKAVKFSGTDLGGTTYETNYGLIVEIDGVPMCGDYDDLIVSECKKFEAMTGIQLTENDEFVGIIAGTCKVWQRVKDPHNSTKFVRGEQVSGVKMRIVGYKAKGIAVAAGGGSSLDKVDSSAKKGADSQATDSASENGSSSSSSASDSARPSGTLHFLHRLVAWAASAMLLLGGLLAFVHGISRFVPQVQEQKAKLGDYLGWLGIGFGLLGALWFGAAAVLPMLSSEVRFGSLPAAALVLAGVVVGLDRARSAGKFDEKLAATLQPIGIAFGAGCFLAALVHVICWDMPLL